MKIQYYTADNDQNSKKASCLQFISSFHVGGSLSLEAALVLPLILLVIAGFMTFFTFLSVETRVQAAIDRVSERMAVFRYGIEKAEDTALGQEIMELADLPVVSDLGDALLVRLLVTDEMEGSAAGGEILAGGTQGLLFLGSGYDEETKMFVVQVSYGLKIPFLPFQGLILPVSQRAAHRAYVGQELEQKEEEQEVYVTENGRVYHSALSCSHLKLSIRETELAKVGLLRNADGRRYDVCELCGKEGSGTVFITDYGDRYHFNKNCSGLKRGIRSIPLREAEAKYPKCSRCKARDGE